MVASQRPKALTIIAWLAIVSGIINLMTVFIPPHFWGLTGVLSIIFGFGALKLKPWAWGYGVGVYIISIIIDVFLLVDPETLLFGVVGLILDGLILYYLFTPSVKRVFGKA